MTVTAESILNIIFMDYLKEQCKIGAHDVSYLSTTYHTAKKFGSTNIYAFLSEIWTAGTTLTFKKAIHEKEVKQIIKVLREFKYITDIIG